MHSYYRTTKDKESKEVRTRTPIINGRARTKAREPTDLHMISRSREGDLPLQDEEESRPAVGVLLAFLAPPSPAYHRTSFHDLAKAVDLCYGE